MPGKRISPDSKTKRCTHCNRMLPVEKFAPRGKTWKSWCRECCAEIQKEWCCSDPEKAREVALNSYHRNKEKHAESARIRAREWHAANRERALESSKRWAAANREKVRGANRKWQLANKDQLRIQSQTRRARLAGVDGQHTTQDVGNQYERQKGRCFYCKTKLNGSYHVDHVTPLALGGPNGPENIVLACPSCNWSKNAKHPMDFCGILL